MTGVIAQILEDGYYGTADFLASFLDSVGLWLRDTASDFQDAIAAALRRLLDPIIVDLDGDGIELTARADSNVVFDMDGDGLKEWTGWIGKDDAFLVIDANLNGKIDSIAELIGDQNRSGFAELVTYDANADGILDAADPTWTEFRLWRDANSNGVTDAGELLTLAQGGIKSIDLHYTTVNFTAAGNRIHETSVFEKTAGGVGTLADAWLDVDNVAQRLGSMETGNTTVDGLPNVRNYGDVPTLREAMLGDVALTTLVNTVVNQQPNQLAGVREQIEQILFRWADTNDVAIDSRGPNFDGRVLATLEKLLGTPYRAGGMSNPTPQAVANLAQAWDRVVDGMESRLLLAGPFKDTLPPTVYDAGVDRFVTIGTIDDVINSIKIGQPATDTLARANYWAAGITVINRLAEDSGSDPGSLAHRSKIQAALGEIGLGTFQDLLHAGISTAVLPAAGTLDKDGVFRLSDAAETANLTAATQAVFALGGDDRLIASRALGYASVMLDGGHGADTLQGTDNADWLDGGAGADRMIGLGGDDTYIVDDAADVVIENWSGGTDTVKSSVDYTLGGDLEHLSLLGTANLKGTGNAQANTLTGNSGANTLSGGDGNDTLDGGAGVDTLAGGLGDDVYYLDTAGETVVENKNAGNDKVFSSVSHTLATNVEALELTGVANINGVGNTLANTLIGNDGANTLNGSTGADWLQGGLGNDIYVVDETGDHVQEQDGGGTDTVLSYINYSLGWTLEHLTLLGTSDIDGSGNDGKNKLTGNAGDNRLDGGADADTMAGGAGDDTYFVDVAGDSVVEALDAGVDSVRSYASFTLAANVEHLTLLGDAGLSGTGNALANLLTGNTGANTLTGGDGNDTLDGGTGADVLAGGLGDDRYYTDDGGDTVSEAAAGGVDTVFSSVSWILGNQIENLVLGGWYVNLDGQGNALANRLTGNDWSNVLDGQGGADILIGLGGDDTYVVDDPADLVIEGPVAGTDTVKSSVDYTLGSDLEHLSLLGTANLKGTGNAQANTLTGNSGANTLSGGDGNDTLDGGAGVDTLAGGLGDDVYYLDTAGETVVENKNAGNDKVFSSVSHTLATNVEALELTGVANINGVGNTLANTLIGNDGANTLNGSTGADWLQGGLGNDIYVVDETGDHVQEQDGGGTDTVLSYINYSLGWTLEHLTLLGTSDIDGSGNDGKNKLTGNAGDNRLDGGADADTMAGGAGDDTYFVDVAGDSVVEALDAGVDSVRSYASFTLAANVEHLTLLGDAGLSGTGNALANLLTGNTGANTLTGGDGNDTLDGGTGADVLAGGLGDDRYYTDDGGDTVSEAAAGGVDTVFSSVSWILGNQIENLVLGGWYVNLDGQGNALANRLTGNDWSNVLDGQGGADILIGLGGDDTYVVDDPADLVIEGPVAGTDTVKSSVDYTLGSDLEHLSLLGTANLKGTGNAQANTLTGNSGANTLSGGDGNDTLDGGAGVDTLAGGLGDDVYYLDTAGETVVENKNAGNDKVFSSVSHTLATNVEALELTGVANINGVGNTLANTLIGNDGANTLNGSTGADWLQGGLGNDIYVVDETGDHVQEQDGGGTDTVLSYINYSLGWTLEHLALLGTSDIDGSGNDGKNKLTGNAGDNRLDGGADADTMAGGAGDDTYFVDVAGDSVVEALDAGVDSVRSYASFTLAANVEHLTLLGDAGLSGTGNALANLLTGNTGANTLTGGDGNDTLDGGTGADVLAGGLGDDRYYTDDGGDTVSEAAAGGVDTVFSSVSWILGNQIENLVLGGWYVNLDGQGNALANRLTGNDWSNVLDGQGGADILIGLGGDDTYVVDDPADLVIEGPVAGTDTVKSSVDYTLGSDLEHLSLLGTANLKGTGNAQANTLTGNSGANTLSGGDGNDTLDGGAGVDTLAGGLGDDVYYLDTAGETVVENKNAGNDKVFSSVSHTLATNVEALELTGVANINGVGNTLANTLIGNDGANTLNGSTGADWLQGGLGNDIYVVDETGDHVQEQDGGGTDTVLSYINYSLGWTLEHLTLLGTSDIDGSGNDGKNKLTGNAGDNRLDGGADADTMAGGAGDDTYFVDVAGDSVVEALDAGVDIVRSYASFTLAANVEHLTLLGDAGLTGTGNALANLLTGNTGANTLTGGDGNDTLDGDAGADVLAGGLGDDRYYTDDGGDTVSEAAAGGVDTVFSSVSWILGNQIENLVLGGWYVNLDGQGNALANRLTGNDWSNVLDGQGGADILIGLGGDDTYVVDDPADLVIEGPVAGTDTVKSSVDYTLGSDLEHLSLLGTANLKGTGNAQANTLTGNSGANTLSGGDGNDTLDGGAGVDTLAGGLGDDVYYLDTAGETVVENKNAGNDKVFSSVSHTLATNVEALELTGVANINGVGNTLANTLIGNDGANTLNGSTGADWLQGGLGNDIYVVDETGDHVQEQDGGGTDTVLSYINYSLGWTLEHLTLLGTSDIDGSGNDGKNKLTGNAGDNRLDGGADADTMAGGAGDDTYFVDIAGDSVVEALDAGVDIVRSYASFTLAANVEHLTLLGDAGLTGTGNALANLLTGNTGANTLTGGDGNDTLDGDAGADVLAGGLGDDRYYTDDGGDTVSEAAAGGVDTVFSSVSWILGNQIENLVLGGWYVNLDGQGNALANRLTGNDWSNVLDGQGGADILIGLGGDDTYVVDDPADLVIEGPAAGTDTVKSSVDYTLGGDLEHLSLLGTANLKGTGNAQANTLTGNSGANTLTGGDGNDTLDGGAGNDTLLGGSGADSLTGGDGQDVFKFVFWSDIGNMPPPQTISDFTTGDKIDFSAVDANESLDGDQAFAFVGAAGFSGAAGQLMYQSGVLEGDVDGDLVADFRIQLDTSPTLAASDFFL
ncbi:MAG: calcium-binding protein [Accumulibacter sp.]|uniref:calcium-binding protein n=1 Tax=Accumulibacter sp. TaxID=2053492 RepID=UPI002FC3BF7D